MRAGAPSGVRRADDGQETGDQQGEPDDGDHGGLIPLSEAEASTNPAPYRVQSPTAITT